MSPAEPIIRHASSAGSVSVPTPLRHPTPDLQSLQGAYIRNVQKLERSAEELSAGGSDIGEEIRKMNELSRQNSIQSSHHGDISVVKPGMMERVGSSRSSRAASSRRPTVDAAARWAGYTPDQPLTSPVGSVSGSWSQVSRSRGASASKSSPFMQISEPMRDGQPLNSPLRESFGESEDLDHSREPSQSSFAKRYDEIAGQIQESLENVPPSPPKHSAFYAPDYEAQNEAADGPLPIDRRQSTDTYREAQLAFKDFDGVHFSADTDEYVELDENGNELRRVSARSSTGGITFEAASLLRTPRARPNSKVLPRPPPPPEEGMVYYPAPVPKVLNLPKRLSQLPAANVQSKRRSQMLQEMSPEVRGAMPWLNPHNVAVGDTGSTAHNNRMSVLADYNKRRSANLANLPPQIRAEMFFEHQPVQHDVQMTSGSAVATLDSILEASASAPVNAFVDHPYAGDVRKSVYSLEHKPRKSNGTNSNHSSPKDDRKKRRSSSISGLFKRATSNDETNMLNQLDEDEQESPSKARKSRTRLSLGDELDKSESFQRLDRVHSEPELQSGLVASAQNADPYLDESEDLRPRTARSSRLLKDGEQIENDFKEEEVQEDLEEEEGDPTFVQPSTLLAELQVRKAQQKSRSKTAATAFPKGMHSTLLQLDAVEEIAKKKRKVQRIELAWEDPHQRALQQDIDEKDEDMPLGILFPAKDGRSNRVVGDGKDLDRPLGLLERRKLEDEEPLSSRRNRLRGVSPSRGRATSPDLNPGVQNDVSQPAENEAEFENETLGQRMRRMKAKEAPEATTPDEALDQDNRLSSGFADEVLSQFGALDVKEKEQNVEAEADAAPKTSGTPAPEEEETLGQRRARLQREREASGEQPTRPPLKTTNSLGHLLAANPIGQRQASKTYQAGQGTLLHTNAQVEAKQRSQLMSTNQRASSYHLERPLIDARPAHQPIPGGLLAAEQSRAMTGGFAAGTYNNGMGGIQLQTSSTTPMFGMNGTNSYFASPTAMPYANYGYGYGASMGYPQMQMPMQMQQPVYQQQSINPYAYNAMAAPQTMGTGFLGNAYLPGMANGTYASYAQNMGGAAGMNMGGAAGMNMGGSAGLNMAGMTDEQITNTQRQAIDRWRLDIAHQ